MVLQCNNLYCSISVLCLRSCDHSSISSARGRLTIAAKSQMGVNPSANLHEAAFFVMRNSKQIKPVQPANTKGSSEVMTSVLCSSKAVLSMRKLAETETLRYLVRCSQRKTVFKQSRDAKAADCASGFCSCHKSCEQRLLLVQHLQQPPEHASVVGLYCFISDPPSHVLR